MNFCSVPLVGSLLDHAKDHESTKLGKRHYRSFRPNDIERDCTGHESVKVSRQVGNVCRFNDIENQKMLLEIRRMRHLILEESTPTHLRTIHQRLLYIR